VSDLPRELFVGIGDVAFVGRVAVRLVVAATLGGLVGFERERKGKAAGMRTHMLVALGAALFTTVPLEIGMTSSDLSRVIQGIVAGIGFLGGGTILKLNKRDQVRGLTSAAGIWLTAAIGMSVGAGRLWPALLGVVFAWVILSILDSLVPHVRPRRRASPLPPRDTP
jgi:putative Mg2+ transporter-C (MgtC) family protein